MELAGLGRFTDPAVLILNEVNPAVVGGLDLIELLTVQAGNAANITIQQNFTNPVTLATLPDVGLYTSYGFQVTQEVQIPMPDGASIAGASMQKAIT